MRIYLVGYMASGKSKIGQQIAAELGYRFVDLDDSFEQRYRISVVDFFSKYDEAGFRNLERVLLHKTALLSDCVIATGGGTPCFFDNMDFILKEGLAIYLYRDNHDLVARLEKGRKRRPLLKNIPVEMLEERISNHMLERHPHYRRAHYQFDAKSGSLPELIRWLQEEMGR